MKVAGISFVAPLLLVLFTLVAFSTIERAEASESMTPLLLAVQDAPVPFMGSDGRVHLVYELEMTNFSSAEITVEKVEVISDGATLQTLDTTAVAARLQPGGQRDSTGTLAKSTRALLFLNVALAPGAKVPAELSHRVSLRVSAAPPGHQEFERKRRQNDGRSAAGCVDRSSAPRNRVTFQRTPAATPFVIRGRPCQSTVACGSHNATRSTGSKPMTADRSMPARAKSSKATPSLVSPFWRLPTLSSSPSSTESPSKRQAITPPTSRWIKPTATASFSTSAITAMRSMPTCSPGSIKVRRGEKVHLGQVIGLVGDTGNSIVPHLHFQVTDGPSSLSSNGFPYEISEFQVTGATAGGTKAFDEAESNGTPLPVTPVVPPQCGQAGHATGPIDHLALRRTRSF